LIKAIPAFNNDEMLVGLPSQPTLSSLVRFDEFVLAQLFYAPSLNLKRHQILINFVKASILNILTSLVTHVSTGANYIHSDIFKHLPSVDPAATDKDGLLQAFFTLTQAVGKSMPPEASAFFANRERLTTIYAMVVKSTLPVFRKASIFVHSVCGAYDALDYSGNMGTREVDRLCEFLRLPPFDEQLLQLASDKITINQSLEFHVPKHEYPGVVRLLRLPERLDEFLNFANIKDVDLALLPADPAVCLFCGANIPVQTTFNPDGTHEGPCTTHMKLCGGDLGIFLLPRRNYILLTRGRQGSYVEGPYLDLHGEPDELMR
jgi:E3 ubiquitin-protein ligase UBR1